MTFGNKFKSKPIQLLVGILLALFLLFYLNIPTIAQTVGGPCQGCEAIFEYGDQKLYATDTLPEFTTHSNKMLITGTVYQADGVTPAAGVIVYAYHTNEKGLYPTRGDEKGWARRHGYLRGWVKTDEKGQYAFYTFKPASYPSRTEPAHVHLIVKEPGKNEYWLDSIEFDDDPLLTAEKRKQKRKRGGNGIVRLGKNQDGHLLCQRDVVLGKNIPAYHD